MKKIIIIGAAGRDFHNFNTYYRDNSAYEVVAFTAAQIPDIAGRCYPPELAGANYPNGIPIYPQEELESLIKKHEVDECVFSYSDVNYEFVMGIGAIVNAAGAAFTLLSPRQTMIKSTKPVIAVGAIRTGCGKSQTTTKIVELLKKRGLNVIAVRHPMPYGDLNAQKVQRFATLDDLKKHNCTIEEMEEYEPHIINNSVIYAGVDYAEILKQVETDPAGCDVILWDGGNNDFSFYEPDLMITVVDPHRPGHELTYYPGEVTLRIADVAVINKIDSAPKAGIEAVKANIAKLNPTAAVIRADSEIHVTSPEAIKGKRVLVIEDGPTLTHGDMKIGAGVVAAERFGAAEIVDPRPYAVGSLAKTYESYPHLGAVLPAMGYGDQQIQDLAQTIENTPCDSVIVATPIDLGRLIEISKPNTRVSYTLAEIGSPCLDEILDTFLKEQNL